MIPSLCLKLVSKATQPYKNESLKIHSQGNHVSFKKIIYASASFISGNDTGLATLKMPHVKYVSTYTHGIYFYTHMSGAYT